MNLIQKFLGENVRNIRKIKDFTQERLAEAAGINQRQLARIEAGQSFISSETLGGICTALQIEPMELFNFKYLQENLKTGTDDNVHFSVIKSGNIYQIMNSNFSKTYVKDEEKQEDIDKNMLDMAKRIKKSVKVDEILEGVVVGTKTYYPNGQIESDIDKKNQLYLSLKDKLFEIKDDINKLSFIDTSFNVFNDKDAVEKLKLILQGLELTLKN